MMAENDNTNLDEILATDDIYISEEQTDIEVIEIVEVIEVDENEPYVVDTLDAFPALGEDNENLKHSLLNGRELADQHPITAITGLQEELEDIERLKTVYSDDRNQANYYLWEDENILQEDRVGYFVSVRSDINEIGICTSESDIFGVTVDGAGFIGAQSDIPRDCKYGLVAHNGIVHVRCELSVNVGDCVISNDYGYATSNNNGYKVVGRHRINGIEYAEITLVTPIELICKLSDNVDYLNERVDDAEINIVAAMNVANAAYNKSGEAVNVSEEAVKNALDALLKADGAIEDVGKIEELVSSANQTAVEAKAIAESAAVSAEAIRTEAVATANDALKDVNDLVKDLEPITTWSDPVTGNTGAEYFTTYIKDGVATKAEIEYAESQLQDHTFLIEKNAKGFNTLVASIDKYSVGEYSQSYGLTHEQAVSILKDGMIYVPTKHSDSLSHSETFSDTEEVNEFTPGSYYVWTINDQGVYDWVETKDAVAFFSEEPVPIRTLQYWYIDSNEAPEGYEPYSLYMYDGNKWVKVNIFYNNPSNRKTSSISQEVDNISLEITNARGSYAGLDARLTNTESEVQTVASWSKDPDGNLYNLATIQQKADDAGASIAQVVESVGADGEVNAASIVTAINSTTGDSIVKIDADHVVVDGSQISLKGKIIDLTSDEITIKSTNFNVDKDGNVEAKNGSFVGHIEANSGNIGGISLNDNSIYSGVYNWVNAEYNHKLSFRASVSIDVSTFPHTAIVNDYLNPVENGAQNNYYVYWLPGTSDILGNLHIYVEGKIENDEYYLVKDIPTKSGDQILVYGYQKGLFCDMQEVGRSETGWYLIYHSTEWSVNTPICRTMSSFSLTSEGILTCSGAHIAGEISAESGDIAGWRIEPTWFGKDNLLVWSDGNTYTYGAGLYSAAAGTPATCLAIGYMPDGVANTWDRAEFRVTGDGKLFAKSGNFSDNITIGTENITVGDLRKLFRAARMGYNDDDSLQIRRIDAVNGSVGGWEITEDAIRHSQKSNADGVTLYNSGIYVYTYNESVDYAASWRTIVKAAEWWSNENSDKNIKNSISTFTDEYEALFDNLTPCRYKYNYGTSDRYHTGYIAQDVVKALSESNLTTKDFAAVVHLEAANDQGSEWMLRRDEFVALNTWQIQKAKARITELENKVAELEALIKGE